MSLPPRRILIALTALSLLVIIVGIGLYLYIRGKRPPSVYHLDAPFLAQPAPPPLPATKKAAPSFIWPLYGFTANHTRFFPASSKVRPPFRHLWTHKGKALLEFPPVIKGELIFQLADNGVLSAINTHTGRDLWWRRIGALSASTPAIVHDTLYATVLDRARTRDQGLVTALNFKTGKTLWSRDLPSQSESSPLYAEGKIFIGSQNGTLYALNPANGHTIWTYRAEGSVKASPTYYRGVLYFGDYADHVQAVKASNGHRLWQSSGAEFLGSGTFYSTAAVLYGRVFLGNTNGRICAYDARTGALDWAVQTGDYVYSSPAATNAPGIGPTIYSGSYNGHFYAINARTGHIDWNFNAGGKISGSPTIIGRVVYFADLGTHKTYGLDISTGRKLITFDTGVFDPVISDGHDIYLSGYSSLTALEPLDESRPPPAPRAPPTKTARG